MTITPLDIAAVALFVIALGVLTLPFWRAMLDEMEAEAKDRDAWRDAQHAALLSLHIMRTVRRP